jgi:hypothetical protein
MKKRNRSLQYYIIYIVNQFDLFDELALFAIIIYIGDTHVLWKSLQSPFPKSYFIPPKYNKGFQTLLNFVKFREKILISTKNQNTKICFKMGYLFVVINSNAFFLDIIS